MNTLFVADNVYKTGLQVASFPDLPAWAQTLYATYFFTYNVCVRAGRSGNEAGLQVQLYY